MPIYEYKCEDCATQFEMRQSLTDVTVVPCPKCQGRARRCFLPAAIIFKGPGFYATDSRKDSPKEEAEKSV